MIQERETRISGGKNHRGSGRMVAAGRTSSVTQYQFASKGNVREARVGGHEEFRVLQEVKRRKKWGRRVKEHKTHDSREVSRRSEQTQREEI